MMLTSINGTGADVLAGPALADAEPAFAGAHAPLAALATGAAWTLPIAWV